MEPCTDSEPCRQIAGMSSVVHLALGCYFAETLLCGCFIALYAIILWQLFSKRLPQGRSRRDMVLIGASAAMFLLAILVRSVPRLHSAVVSRWSLTECFSLAS